MSEGLFLLRLAVGAIFIYHAIPKLKNPNSMASGVGWAPNQVLGLGIIEFISAVGVVGGVGLRLSSLALSIIMIGAIYYKVKKWNIPFSASHGTGWEFDLILLAANLTIYLNF